MLINYSDYLLYIFKRIGKFCTSHIGMIELVNVIKFGITINALT